MFRYVPFERLQMRESGLLHQFSELRPSSAVEFRGQELLGQPSQLFILLRRDVLRDMSETKLSAQIR